MHFAAPKHRKRNMLVPPSASAVFHPSPTVRLAALKFFLGQDAAVGDDSDDEGDKEEDAEAAEARKGPGKEDFYKAYKTVAVGGGLGYSDKVLQAT